MQINIGEKYVVTSDKLQLILKERKVKGKDAGDRAGETYLSTVGFYPKLSYLINALCELEVRLSDIQSLQAMQQHISRVALQCEQAFKESEHV